LIKCTRPGSVTELNSSISIGTQIFFHVSSSKVIVIDEDTRVKLRDDEGVNGYINANYVHVSL
jgi:protein tyrosine phosphatase